MRILQLDSELTWRGGQNQTRLLVDGLLSSGHKVYLAAPQNSALVHAMSGKIPVVPLQEFRLKGIWTNARKVAEFYQSELIDVLDAQSSKAHTVALLAKIFFNPKINIVVHRRVDFVPHRHFISQYKYRTKKISAFIAISNAIADVLKNFGVDPAKIHVARSATPPPRLPFPDHLSARLALAKAMHPLLDPDIPWIANVAALTEQKDHHTLLRAANILKQSGVSFHMLIAGQGHLDAQLRQLARELNLEDCVHFLGFRDDVFHILQASDVFALSSAFEGLGTIILDALQSDLCVVATNVGGIPEIIKHGETGVLCEPRDPQGIADGLRLVLNDKKYAQLLAKAGHERVKNKFSLEQMVAGNLKVYRQTASNDNDQV